jgi:hypothetical protein
MVVGCGENANGGKWYRSGRSNYWADRGKLFPQRPYETDGTIEETQYTCGKYATDVADGWLPLCHGCLVKNGLVW